MIHNPLLENFSSLSGTIALIGGTFDPVHNGHLQIAQVVLERLPSVRAVVFIPAKQNPLKENPPVASDMQRLEMLRLALAETPRLFVSPIETSRDGRSYTVDTLIRIRAEVAPQSELLLMIGADQLASLHQWRDIEGVFKRANVYVLGREGINPSTIASHLVSLPSHVRALLERNFIPFSQDVSATTIRASIKAGHLEAVKELIPASVLSFIERAGLYR